MSFWDNVKKLTQPYGEEDYDDYDDEMNDYSAEEDTDPAPRKRRSPFTTAEPIHTAEPTVTTTAPATPAPASTGFGGQVLNMATGKQEVVLYHAKTFDDAARAADELRKKKAVILNMENVDKSLTRRVVDFLSGAVYAVDGSVKKVAQSTYLFCPHNMDVVGDLENIKGETESYI